MSPLHLPDVRAPAQYLVDMGFRPALARRISGVYMDLVARYRQTFESCFRRAIHGGRPLNPEYYCNLFVVQFKSAIQVLGYRLISTACVWLYRAGLFPTPLSPHRIDVRVDAATKAQILSILGLTITPLNMDKMNQCANVMELPEEECTTEGDSSTKLLPASLPLQIKSSTPPVRDLFSQEVSSTCFPVRYPPPPGEPISSPRKSLATQFLRTTSTNNKQFSNCSIDMSPLITRLGQISVTASELKAQGNRKCIWAPRPKKSEPLSPLLSPVVAGVSDSPPKLQPSNTGVVSCAKAITALRKRRIATLPTRHGKTTALPILDSSLSANPPISALISNSARLPTPVSRIAEVLVTKETPIDCNTSSPQHVQPSETSDTLGSKPPLSERRKRLPPPRRMASQATSSQRRPLMASTPSGQRTPFSTVLRTPSLVSDASSCADSISSDEFDTPPSTPSSHSHPCNALAASITSKSNITGPFGLPISAKPGRKGIHIDFANGDMVGERQLSFTFRA